MDRVFLTGADGFTGRHLSQKLIANGYQVLFDNKLDIRDLSRCKSILTELQPNYVIHLAGISTVHHADLSEIYDVNLKGTLNILQALLPFKNQVHKVILASSAKVYGAPKSPLIDESHPVNPTNHYAVSKIAMEYMAAQFFNDLPILIVRPFNYTGPGQSTDFLIPKLVDSFKSKQASIRLGNLNLVRDFSHIDFVISAYVALMESSYRSDVFNLCSGTGILLSDIISILESITHHHLQIESDISLSRTDDFFSIVGSNKKIRDAIGIEHTAGMNEIIQSFFK